MNPMQIIQGLSKSKGNPKIFIENVMKNNSNPILANAVNLMQQGKENEVEQIARNLCKEKGLNYEEEFKRFKNMVGWK